jgi:hypothetical protein
MRLVAAGAEILAGTTTVPCQRLIEAGLVVTYCRPFSGPPKEGTEPKTEVDALAPKSHLHQKLFEARNKMYAHTDEDYPGRREAVDPFGGHSYAEQYPLLNPNLLQPFGLLALALAEQFKEERKAREQRLRDAGVPSELSR